MFVIGKCVCPRKAVNCFHGSSYSHTFCDIESADYILTYLVKNISTNRTHIVYSLKIRNVDNEISP